MNMQKEMLGLARDARQAGRVMANLSSAVKNDLLRRMATALEDQSEPLIAANELDLAAAREP